MTNALPLLICTMFVLLGLWQVYMAFNISPKVSAAIPSIGGKPLFVPSKASTLAVGIVLFLFAGLVASTAGMMPACSPGYALRWASYALALGLLVRAIGKFKYVGFFKKVRGSSFARMDTFVYSPLCLVLSAGIVQVAYHSKI